MFPEENRRCTHFATCLARERFIDLAMNDLVLRQSVIPFEAFPTVVAQKLSKAAVDIIFMPGQMGSQL